VDGEASRCVPAALPPDHRVASKAAGWKVKIREKERVEPPHVTIMHKVDEWRLGLRDRRLLVPPGGRIRDIDPAVMQIIEGHWERLIAAWDEKYPENPVSSGGEEDDGNGNGD
jgi:hypothetical protein